MYGRQTESAIAALSRLAEVYDEGRTRLSSAEISRSRGLRAPLVSKLLSILAGAGLVTGTRGPGGGFALARAPSQIRLYDVYVLFERDLDRLESPLGDLGDPGKAGPLARKVVSLRQAMRELLRETTFEVFRAAYQDEGRRPPPRRLDTLTRRRESYRAPRSY